MNSITITIGGVKVKFPSSPYPSQISMMNQVIKGLQRKQNCLLESPTGSGKTLALLCSALAWQFSEKNAANKAEASASAPASIVLSCFCDCNSKLNEKLTDNFDKYKKKPGIKYDYEMDEKEVENSVADAINRCPCSCHGMYTENKVFKQEEIKNVPTIYFGTRTHKQIANVVKELRKTAYANEIRMTILSSRQHSCVHPKISKSSRKNELCRELVKGKNSNKKENSELAEEFGCVYLSRWKKMPLSFDVLNLEKNVWDIEDLVTQLKRKKLCPYYVARDLTPIVDIIFCPYNYLIDPRIRSTMSINLKEQIVILDEAHNIEDACREATSFIITKIQLDIAKQEIELASKLSQPEEIISALVFFGFIFDRLNGWLMKISDNLEHNDSFSSMSKIWNGFEIVAEFKILGIGPESFEDIKKKSTELFNEESPDSLTDGIKLLVEHLILILECLYSNDFRFTEDYRVAITKTRTEELPKDDFDLDTTSYRTQQNNEWTFAINFWCFNSSVAFNYLTSCHSVILCSGTLAPMETFQSELGCKFDFQLEANHVIAEKQVWVGALGYGPRNTNLQATFKNCETYAFQDEIGRLVIDICKTVPYGVLCFLPSYTLLNKLTNRWNQTNMIQEMQKYKIVYSESRVARDFNDLLTEYYHTIENSHFEDERNGALLFAVYRGRASEGLDFSDNYARAVIAVGIPFPNVKDVKVDLKRKYNNALCKKKNLLNGDEWYEIQAYRAVNQALGRCIRHKFDWGAIILVDERYLKQPQKYSKGLSKWIRKQFNTFQKYPEAISSIKTFVDSMKDFKKPCENLSSIPSNIDLTSTLETTPKVPLINEIPEKVSGNDSSDSLESFDHNEIENSNCVNTQLTTGNESQKMKPMFSIFENNESPSIQRKRRQRKPLDERKNKTKSANESEYQDLNLKSSKIRGDKSLLFDELIITDDESEDDFKQLKRIKDKMTKKDNLCELITDDEDPSSMASKVKNISSTFQPAITSTFRSSTFQPPNTSTQAKSSKTKTQTNSNSKDLEYEYID